MFDKIKKIFNMTFRVSTENEIYGLNVDKWTYIGKTTLAYSNTDIKSYLHFFAEKDNEENGKRRYVHSGSYSKQMKDHLFILNVAEIWLQPENAELYSSIGTSPSTWLKNSMAEHSFVWNDDECKWRQDGDLQYDAAVKKEKTKNENNIVPFKIVSSDSDK